MLGNPSDIIDAQSVLLLILLQNTGLFSPEKKKSLKLCILFPLLTHRLPDLPSFIKGAPGSDLPQLLGDWLPRTAQRDPLSHHLSQK